MREAVFQEDVVLIDNRMWFGSSGFMAQLVAEIFGRWPSLN